MKIHLKIFFKILSPVRGKSVGAGESCPALSLYSDTASRCCHSQGGFVPSVYAASLMEYGPANGKLFKAVAEINQRQGGMTDGETEMRDPPMPRNNYRKARGLWILNPGEQRQKVPALVLCLWKLGFEEVILRHWGPRKLPKCPASPAAERTQSKQVRASNASLVLSEGSAWTRQYYPRGSKKYRTFQQ